MANYESFSGVDSPLEAFGLKGMYIPMGIGAVIGLFILAVVLSNTRMNVFLSIAIVIIVSGGTLTGLTRLSKRFGLYGVMKTYAAKSLPVYIKNNLILKMRIARRKDK